MESTPVGAALALLDRDQLYVVVSFYWGRVTERQIAGELTVLRGATYSRDRVHRIRLTAQARLERQLQRLVAA